MRTAEAMVEAISIWCPGCKGPMMSHHGSSMLTREDVAPRVGGEVVTCGECGEKFKLPAIVNRLA